MELNLDKDIVFFDIESTGLSISNDRIVQLAIIKYFADGREPIERCRLVNPEMPISPEATEVHGITNEDVFNEPTFKKLANGVRDLIGDADLCGFNSNRFDVPMLLEEFHRVGVDFDMTDRKTIDAWKIFQKMEPRDLKSALRFYCGQELEGAHDALNDVRATVDVLKGQLDKYQGVNYDDGKGNVEEEPIKNNMQSLHNFSTFEGQIDYAARMLMSEDGVAVFNFGKYQNQSVVDVIQNNPGYYNWLMKSDFATDSKKHLERIMEEHRSAVAAEKVQE